jgi:hypothetical protein
MNRQVRVFIEGRELDLFQDEQIQVSTSIQNVYDISKSHTDASQSFTVPGTAKNNQIFEHFYENSIDGTLDYGLRRDGYIEIDLTTFRKGRISLEKATIKNGSIHDYTITFYGNLLSLKDKFGEDKLKDLDYSSIEHDWTLTDIVNRIDGTLLNPDVAWPLITSNRLWEYNGALANYTLPNFLTSTITSNDIATNPGAIDPKAELFPAIRISKIMEFIEAKYGVTFNSTFFANEKFTNAYIWYKNKNVPKFSSAPQDIDITGLNTSSFTTYNLTPYVDYVNNSIRFAYLTGAGASYHVIDFTNITVSVPGLIWYIDVYRNGTFFNTIDCLDIVPSGNIQSINAIGLDETYTFKIRTEQAATVNVFITHSFLYAGATMIDYFEYQTSLLTYTGGTNLASAAPDIKIADFFAGIMKEFNLICEGTAVNEYTVEPLLDWYASGRIFDITKYTDITSVEVAKVPLYKRIAFKYQTSESAMNKYYFQQWSKEYGNTDYQFPYDGAEYTIDVPFENMMFNKFTGDDLQVGYCLNSSLAPYIPKPLILYKYDLRNLTQHIHYHDTVTGARIANDYLMFGQDFKGSDTIDYSLNFAPETSTYHLYPIQQSLFATYYFQYLTNLYNIKNRLTTFKTILPISLLTGLRMNDRVIIRDKRYIINDMKSNLVTGDVTLTLLNDFMPVSPDDIIPPLPDDREL